ncbi:MULTISPECIES: hypothetical protein [unclassified Nocardiopsis]|uniref:hypothetical protein n=1 Tax=unclassified Nocardiopsis TaxID=2649073 RepID=UPI00135AA2A6|nr:MULTISPECIES: hypothetical protein [unclassified Nocardiopsis]
MTESHVELDHTPDAEAVFAELGVAHAALAAAQVRYAEVEQRLRALLATPTAPGRQVVTWRGRPVATLAAYTERRVNLKALRDSWPEVAETVTETRLRSRFTVTLPGGSDG